MTFQSFAIYDLRSGLNLAQEPWKSPADSFTVLDNFMLRRGLLRKRNGMSVYGQQGERQSETIHPNPSPAHQTGTLTHTPVIPRSIIITSGTKTAYDDGEGSIVGDVAAVGGAVVNTINYTTGVYNFDFNAAPGAFITTAVYHTVLVEDTRGIIEFNRYVGSNHLLTFQTKRMSKYNTTYESFENIASFGGDYELWDSTNLVWTLAYNDNLWITDKTVYNAGGGFPVNGIRYYDGSVIRDPIADDGSLFYGAGANDYYVSAAMIFSIEDRIFMLDVKEGAAATHYPQRVIWCWKGNPTAVTAWRRDMAGHGGYVDAPTNENIISLAVLGNMPIVGFEHSVWALDYVGDPNEPVKWRRISGSKDVSATFSAMEYTDAVAFLGGKGLVATNGSLCDNFDKVIPDFIYNVDLDNISKVCAGKADDYDQAWLAYPTMPDSSTNNSVLVYNYEDKAFSKYDLECFCFGTWISSSDLTFADYHGITVAEMAGIRWGSSSMQAGYPLLLTGGGSGYIYNINDDEANTDVTDWDGTTSNIDFELQTGRLNPFIEKGYEVLLQQVGFFVTKLTSGQFSVDFYVDEDLEPIWTSTIDCSTGTGDKMWVFADAVISGEFIKMRIYLSDAQKADVDIPLQQLEIHGMLLWMKQGARIKQ